MENNHLTYTGGIYDAALENYLEEEHLKLLEKARIKGKHFAKQNRPDPKGDTLDSYVGDLVTGFEPAHLSIRKHQKNATFNATEE